MDNRNVVGIITVILFIKSIFCTLSREFGMISGTCLYRHLNSILLHPGSEAQPSDVPELYHLEEGMVVIYN